MSRGDQNSLNRITASTYIWVKNNPQPSGVIDKKTDFNRISDNFLLEMSEKVQFFIYLTRQFILMCTLDVL